MMKNPNFDIAKKCYEKQFNTQKYENSVLHNTFGDVVGCIMEETKLQVRKEMLSDIKQMMLLIAALVQPNTVGDDLLNEWIAKYEGKRGK